MLYRYLLIVLAIAAVLVGIQVPGFIDQYEKRVDAHLSEVTTNLRGFEEIARRHHGGSFEALLREHETSTSPTFRDEAKPLRDMLERRETFLREQQALQTGLLGQATHILFDANRELLAEARASYSYSVVLTPDTVMAGAALAAIAVLLMELLAQALRWPLRRRARRMRYRY